MQLCLLLMFVFYGRWGRSYYIRNMFILIAIFVHAKKYYEKP